MAFIKTITSSFFDTDEMKELNIHKIFYSFSELEKGIYLVNQLVGIRYILSYKDHWGLSNYNRNMLDAYSDKNGLSNNPLINDYIYTVNTMCDSWIASAYHKNPMVAKAIDIINWLRKTTSFSASIKYNEFIYFLTKPSTENTKEKFLYIFNDISKAMAVATSLYAIEKYNHLYGELNVSDSDIETLMLQDEDNNTFNSLNFEAIIPYPYIDVKNKIISFENSVNLNTRYQINYRMIRNKKLNNSPLLVSILKNIDLHGDNNNISTILLVLSYFCLSKNIYEASKNDTEFFIYAVRSYVEGNSISNIDRNKIPSLPTYYIDLFKTTISNGLTVSTTNGIDYPTYLKTNFYYQSEIIRDTFYFNLTNEGSQISVATNSEVSVETFNLLKNGNDLLRLSITMAADGEEDTTEDENLEPDAGDEESADADSEETNDDLDFSENSSDDDNPGADEDSSYDSDSSSEIDAHLPNTNANTNSKSGIKIELDQNPSLDSVMFKREIVEFIDILLIDDKLEPTQVNSLKNIKTKWIGLLSTSSIIDLVETVLRRTIIKRN